MQSQLPPGIDKLAQVPPSLLKSEHQQSQPANSAVHLPVKSTQQQLPTLQMPLLQWQVVRMLYAPHTTTAMRSESPYSQLAQSSPILLLGEHGVLEAKVMIDNQLQQIRWQIQQGEAVVIQSSLPKEIELLLLPTLHGGWRMIVNNGEVNEPLQLLWRLDHYDPTRHGLHRIRWWQVVLVIFSVLLTINVLISV